MFKGKLRAKFLISLLLIITVLTSATLLIVRSQVRRRVRDEIFEALHNSEATFQNFRRQREATLARSAGLVASLPVLKAAMTTQHEATIQDASAEFWRLMGSDLFVLGSRAGKVVALHTATGGFSSNEAQEFLGRSLSSGEARDWWFGNGHLYEVFIQPIYFGSPSDNSTLGVLAVGYEIDARLAAVVSQVASSQVAFRYGRTVVVSTLSPAQQTELARHIESLSGRAAPGPEDLQLGRERYLSTSVDLAPAGPATVNLSVLKSYDQATAFLESLNRMLLGLGVAAVLAGSLLVFLISDTFTRPLANLVEGVRALAKGDYAFPLPPHGADEVSELTSAFDRMRHSLQKTQQELLDAERLATIGRMAGSISHDLRHPLTAFMAYSEFLAEGNLDEQQRKDLYQEIRQAVNHMTDLISSLLEFSKAREEFRPTLGNVEETIQRAVHTVRARPEFRRVAVTLSHEGESKAWFDDRKLERVFHNLLLNACEAVPPDSGKIELSTRRTPEWLEIRVADNGSGIPAAIREIIFEPFVSYGKQNGTGLGLAVVQKIIQDHGGQVSVESSGQAGAVFKLTLPLKTPAQKKTRP